MYIEKVSLHGFRNLDEINIELNKGINIFYGDNAQGKTNFLESIYFCATGRSQRTRNDCQLVSFLEKESHIRVYINKKNYRDRIDVHLKKEGKKGIAVNGIPIRKLGELFGTMHVVIFSPEDLNLIKEGPAVRRRFLDMELCQLSNIYYFDLQKYYHILKQRNLLLKEITHKPALRDTIFVWDLQLIDFGKRIISSRERFIDRLNEISMKKEFELTGGKDCLKIEYKPNVYEEQFEDKLNKNIQRDIFMGSTQIGPHKDDVLFLVNDKDVKIYGSQGQQRTTALVTKLSEIDLIKQETGHTPILLLDDVLSELDLSRQDYLLSSISELQTILTCTGIEDVIKKYTSSCYVFHVEDGNISKISIKDNTLLS